MLFHYLALFGIVLLAQCDACSVPLFSIIVIATKILGYFGGPFESFAALVLMYTNLCVFTLFPPKELPAEEREQLQRQFTPFLQAMPFVLFLLNIRSDFGTWLCHTVVSLPPRFLQVVAHES